jgi:hypothetical protein
MQPVVFRGIPGLKIQTWATQILLAGAKLQKKSVAVCFRGHAFLIMRTEVRQND